MYTNFYLPCCWANAELNVLLFMYRLCFKGLQSQAKDTWAQITGGTRGTRPPEFGVGGTIMQIVPRRFCHISTKMSVLWPSENAKIRFWPGLCPGPHWGSSRRSPRPPSRLKRGHSSAYSTPLGTNPPSARAMRPPHQNSSQIYAYGKILSQTLFF